MTKSIEWTRKILRLRNPESIDKLVKEVQRESWNDGMVDAADLAMKSNQQELYNQIIERTKLPWEPL